jgi:hypothetical protein
MGWELSGSVKAGGVGWYCRADHLDHARAKHHVAVIPVKSRTKTFAFQERPCAGFFIASPV